MALGCDGGEHSWPSDRYRDDPVGYFREVLGCVPWSRQVETIEAVRDHGRVAVASGHKVSKSHTAVGVALWFYCSFEDARVVMTSTTSRQVDQVLWRELKMMHARAGLCADCKALPPRERPVAPCEHSQVVDGEPAALARSGLRSGFREVVGFTAREAEAVAGVSGKNLLYIVDEASGVADEIYEAIEGNRAGGARILLLGNPTRTEGEHFEAFHSKAEFYHTIRISSEETPNVIEGREVIPGLAGRAWVEEKRREWGVESAQYKIRVKGEHCLSEDGKIISVHAICESEGRHADTPAEGRLFLGVDPAGPGDAGDEIVMAPRRGKKVIELLVWRGLSEEAIVVHVATTVKKHRQPRDLPPVVVIDREGPIGSRVFGMLKAYVVAHPGSFEVVGVRSSDAARREPQLYDRMRDELWANLASWMADEGAIPEDTKLAKELHAPEWIGQVNGKLKVTPKKELRKALGRSPDRADAVALSVWESAAIRAERNEEAAPPAAPQPVRPRPSELDELEPDRVFDPYRGMV